MDDWCSRDSPCEWQSWHLRSIGLCQGHWLSALLASFAYFPVGCRFRLHTKCRQPVSMADCANSSQYLCAHLLNGVEQSNYRLTNNDLSGWVLTTKTHRRPKILQLACLRLLEWSPSAKLSNKNELASGCVQWQLLWWTCEWVKRASVYASEHRMGFRSAILYFRLNEIITKHAIRGGGIPYIACKHTHTQTRTDARDRKIRAPFHHIAGCRSFDAVLWLAADWSIGMRFPCKQIILYLFSIELNCWAFFNRPFRLFSNLVPKFLWLISVCQVQASVEFSFPPLFPWHICADSRVPNNVANFSETNKLSKAQIEMQTNRDCRFVVQFWTTRGSHAPLNPIGIVRSMAVGTKTLRFEGTN